MKKYIVIVLLFVTLASCNNPVSDIPVDNWFDDIIFSR